MRIPFASPHWKGLVQRAGSLRFTIVLLFFSCLLVFLATMAQTQLGIWEVMSRYIRTWFVWWTPEGKSWGVPIFPGGWILGGLLTINLLAAHLQRFRGKWYRRAPLVLIHGGIVLLLLGEWVTALFAEESNLTLNVGETRNYTEHPREAELVVIDTTDPDHDEVWAMPENYLEEGETLEHPKRELEVRVHEFFQNSRVFQLPQEHVAAPAEHTIAENGLGPRLRFEPQRPVVSTDGRNVVSAVVEIIREGESLGTWAASTALTASQSFEAGERSYRLAMRPERSYLDYSFRLHEFEHERHPGTNIPSHFASRLQLINPESGEDREVRISMNQPLRYEGRTFYQASFANNDQTSILQVVRNPGWLMPYVACGLVTVGLIWQFVLRLRQSERKASARQISKPAAPLGQLDKVGWGLVGVAAVWLLWGLFPSGGKDRFNWEAFGSLPIMAEGRLKAMDTTARGYLQTLSGKTSVDIPENGEVGAMEWLLTLWSDPETTDTWPVFTVFHPEVITLLEKPEAARQVLAFNEFRPLGQKIQKTVTQADSVPKEERSDFQRSVLNLDYKLTLYWRLRHSLHLGSPEELGELIKSYEARGKSGMGPDGQSGQMAGREGGERETMQYSVLADFGQVLPIPFGAGDNPRGEWVTMGDAFLRGLRAEALSPAVGYYHDLLRHHNSGDTGAFNSTLHEFNEWLSAYFPEASLRADVEAKFNRMNLFYKGMVLYLAAFLLVAISWLLGPRWRRWAFGLAMVALIAHTMGLGIRIYIQERPPVTSLYASAVFVGWVGMFFALLAERYLKNGLGLGAGTFLGFMTLVVAYNLGGGGDTIEAMRAVLDSNFWLATHVVVITIGYASVFVAGFLAVAYLLAGLSKSPGIPSVLRSLEGAVFGMVCFALLFSFAGTVLGGIWADQSWGRFWGWDPKENGALMIVLWMAIVLHLKIGRIGTVRHHMACTVFGNVVVAFSWFGVNMLGVGLHSYGFMEGAPFWLGLFVASQLVLMSLVFFQRSEPAHRQLQGA